MLDAYVTIPSLNFRIWRREESSTMPYAHVHADIEVNYFQAGHLSYMLSGRKVVPVPGSTLIFWAGVPHQSIEASRDLRGIWMTLPLPWLLRRQSLSRLQARLLSGAPILLSPQSDFARLMPRWALDYPHTGSADFEAMCLEIESAFLRLGAHFPQSDPAGITTGDALIHRTCDLMATRYHEDLSAESIAATLGVHPKYLLSRFRKVAGVSLWTYLTQLRVAHAQRLLLQSDAKVLDVAFGCGFQSNSAFYAAFKKLTGQTPVEYRKARKAG